MAVIHLSNRSDGWLVMWLEPLGEDRWLRPGETFHVSSDHPGSDTTFTVEYWARDEDRAAGTENVNVWIDNDIGNVYAEVIDDAGRVVPCGHQRPEDVDRRWKAGLEEAMRRLGKT
jgi:hypothetical protein